MRLVQLVPFLVLAACFDPAKSPSCTIMCATSSDCPDGLTCGAGNLCTTGEDCTMPATCTANEFVACLDSTTARSCNATGDGTVDQACGNPGCNSVARRCNSCVPDEVSCTSDTMAVQQCMADGSTEMMTESCAQGCVAASGMVPAHCAYLSPQWLPDICDQVATMDSYAPNASSTLTSSLDTNCTQIIMQSVLGPEICVVRAKSITIPNAVTLTIDGTRAMAFVADTSLDVLGTIDASANGSTNGPGVARTSGVAGTSTAAGGGAGFGTAGASGGNGTNTGGSVLDPLTLVFFAGGAHAASGTGIFDPAGGGGGGGVLLIACRGEVTVSGVIDAGGGGGRPGYDTTAGLGTFTPSKAAAGGGSGGYIVLQGLTVKVDGQIYANGGGGGAGNTMDDGHATAGADGLRSTSPAAGGTPVGGGAGGNGGSLGNAPVNGAGSANAYAGGGGGGAVGVLQIYAPMNVTPVTTGSTVSPSFTAKKTSTLR